ncbi:BatD family protein [Aquimarina intermedia]|uniref:DUF4381 domain-containing protein n=1 Tax=Aquimarina intermedia TaxID=350814 RepID=A0A5S5CD82_9FLAO|nr:protein BatD [Aquimarina intermedia]TYP76286.1 hypothetical protein BD809_102504 [Aquimarina intermedia]
MTENRILYDFMKYNRFPQIVMQRILILVSFFLLTGTSALAQVKAQVDSISIKIGEEIQYTLEVQADSTQTVVFPEGKTFLPMEVIESFPADTTIKNNRYNIIKKYGLTQFDTGAYTIPGQRVLIGEQAFTTDSIQVEVREVLVDTTKQKMFEIKPMVEVDPPSFKWRDYVWYAVIILLVGALLIFLLRYRKKKKAEKAKELPPYERAIEALRMIDTSDLLEKDSHKEYYSILSDTARKYIDEEIYDHAMESTTDELIARLNREIESGTLLLESETLQELKRVLMTADLAKFAKSRPDKLTARADRTAIEQVINKTKEAIPEPTEEELLADEEYRKTKAQKEQQRKIVLASIAVVAVVGIIFGVVVWRNGYQETVDSIFGHPTRTLAKQEWISSAYGTPPVAIATPEVLLRNNYQLTEEQKQILKGNETFVYGEMTGNIYIAVSTVAPDPKNQVDLEKAVEGIVGKFESQGAKNITVKTEEYRTLGGTEGIKVFGNLEVTNPTTQEKQKNEYIMLNFAENGGFQQITVVFDEDDLYADEVAQRIITSVELKNADR